jgi:hypothetical protein
MDPLCLYLALLFFSPLFIFLTHVIVARFAIALRLTIQPLMTGVLAVVITLAWFSWRDPGFLWTWGGSSVWSFDVHGARFLLLSGLCDDRDRPSPPHSL